MPSIAVTDASFDTDVLRSHVPVVVDFWAEWCAPCRAISGALEDLSAHYGSRLKVAKVDIEQNPDIAAQLRVQSLPALFLFKDGQVVTSRAGAAPRASLQAWIDAAL